LKRGNFWSASNGVIPCNGVTPLHFGFFCLVEEEDVFYTAVTKSWQDTLKG